MVPKPAYPAPQRPPNVWNLSKLQTHAQTAVYVELYTIPLYLFAAYSVAPEDESGAKVVLIGKYVVKQEMLHLALAGNLLCAIGGQPKLHHPEYTPTYPRQMFYQDRIDLHLWPAFNQTIETFIRVEEPFKVPDATKGAPLLSEYNSIGDFYRGLLTGLDELANDNIFNQERLAMQFNKADKIYRDTPGIIQIGDLQTAKQALNIIIEQGEGKETLKNPEEDCHWQRFQKLNGVDIKHYPTVRDPQTSNFTGKLYTEAWVSREHRAALVKNIGPLMGEVLSPICEFLVQQPLDVPLEDDDDLGETQKFAAPAFNYYHFKSNKLLNELQEVVGSAQQAYPSIPEWEGVLNATKRLFDLSDLNVAPQS
ncbi:hypothetical protein FRC09_001932 [Ceratobasidium sp. 395]|nr:hypothetical protein FRC09_001932 [Ceratobasidium sp. 395]